MLKLLNRSLPAAIFFNAVLILMWFAHIFILKNNDFAPQITVFGSVKLFSVSYTGSIIIQFLSFILIALIASSAVNTNLNIITYLQFTLIMLFGTLWGNLHFFNESTIAIFFLIIAFWQFISIDLQKVNTATVFNTILLIYAAGFFVPEFLALLPICIFGFFYFWGIKHRLFYAVIFSIIMPVLCFLAICYLTNSIEIFTNFYQSLFSTAIFFIPFNIYSSEKLAQHFLIIVILFFTLISLYFYRQNSGNYKLYTRRLLSFLIIVWFYTFFTPFFYWQRAEVFAPLIIMLSSLFMTLNFMNFEKLRNKILFYEMLTLLIADYIFQFAA
ncbi:MAG: hypothetical protein LBB53_00865 [Prevotellaceae bacterium]|nr:hypothetical protein [Prevotellaceae bacterium]